VSCGASIFWREAREASVKVLISGASGLVGSALAAALRTQGHSAVCLVRHGAQSQSADVLWNPATGEVDAALTEDTDAVVNLAGASIAGGRWSAPRKQLLRSSRVDLTRNLILGLSKLRQPPKAFISASAIGYYGDRNDDPLTEASAPGTGFLANLARDWESAAMSAANHGMRTVRLRFGIILSGHGGALAKMLLLFKMGLGGRLGSGKQWMSWITLEDVVAIILHTLNSNILSGPVNVASPHPVQNDEFTRVLARVLHRPGLLSAPGFALRLALGEMADALLLSSQRVVPQVLESQGYVFRHAQLEPAFDAVLRSR
jgi:uncharacterized protein